MWKSKSFQLWLQAIVLLLLSGFLLHRLLVANDPREQWSIFTNRTREGDMFWLLLAVLLMPLNWLLETVKWKLLLKNERPVFSDCAKGVLAGITFGFVTPARMGEFAGRAYYISSHSLPKVFLLSSWGGMAQTLATIATAALFFPLRFNEPLLNGVVIGVALSFLLLYFSPAATSRLMMQWSWLRDRKFYLQTEEIPPFKTLVLVLLLSWIRFAVYAVQYVLLFWFSGIQMDSLSLFVNSVLVLCANSVSPLLPVFDLSWRGSVVLGVFGKDHAPVLLLFAMLLVWLINLALPAMAGFVFFKHRSKAIMHAVE